MPARAPAEPGVGYCIHSCVGMPSQIFLDVSEWRLAPSIEVNYERRVLCFYYFVYERTVGGVGPLGKAVAIR